LASQASLQAWDFFPRVPFTLRNGSGILGRRRAPVDQLGPYAFEHLSGIWNAKTAWHSPAGYTAACLETMSCTLAGSKATSQAHLPNPPVAFTAATHSARAARFALS